MKISSAEVNTYKRAILKYLGDRIGYINYLEIINAVAAGRKSHERALLVGNRALEILVVEGKVEKAYLRTQDASHLWKGPKKIHYRIK